MPNIKSVIKDVKRSRQRRLRNQATKSQIKTYVKKTSRPDRGRHRPAGRSLRQRLQDRQRH